MQFASGSSSLSREELLSLAEKTGTLLLNPEKINSDEELLLAERLANDSMREKRALAKKMETEFLLWLSGKKDISSALKEYGFRSPENILLISFSKKKQELTRLFSLKEKKMQIRKKSTPEEIERISLSRTL